MFSSLGKRSSSTEEPTSTAGWLGMGIVYTTLTANNIFKKETVLSLKSYKYTAFHCSYFLRRFINCYTVVSGFDIFLLFSFCFLSHTCCCYPACPPSPLVSKLRQLVFLPSGMNPLQAPVPDLSQPASFKPAATELANSTSFYIHSSSGG